MLFLTSIIDEMYEYDRVEDMKFLFDLVFTEDGFRVEKAYKMILLWIDDMLDTAKIPEGWFRTLYVERIDASDLINYIRDNCNPEVQARCAAEVANRD